MPTFHRILTAIDGSEPSNAAVALAVGLAAEQRAELTFCHVVDVVADYRSAAAAEMLEGEAVLVADDEAEAAKIVDAAVAEAREAGIGAAGAVWKGNPAETIAERAREGGFDLVVTGTHGYRGLERLILGSTAEGILKRCPVPVLCVRERPAPRSLTSSG